MHVGSRYARRFCALGAIKRVGRDLGLPIDDASSRALEWQTMQPMPDWNDNKARTHAEVAAFDAAIVAFSERIG